MRLLVNTIMVFFLVSSSLVMADVRLKELGRIEGVRDFDVTGYGLVVGLAGTGDSPRNKATQQSIKNTLIEFGVNVDIPDISSRNVASVIVTGKLSPFAQVGDKIDLSVSSIGDARSLVGGTLLLTPLKAVDNNVYALGQGQISVGGYKFDFNGNMIQKNHPTVGVVPAGATIEKPVANELVDGDGVITVVLNSPDFTTASRVEKALNKILTNAKAEAVNAGKIEIHTQGNVDVVDLIAKVENTRLVPDKVAKVIINERTGTVVSGGDVVIDNVTISQGDLKVVIETDYEASQPSFVYRTGDGVRSVVLPQSNIDVNEQVAGSIELPQGTTIGEMVTALRQIKTSTRDIITILQAIHKADALHAQLIIQ